MHLIYSAMLAKIWTAGAMTGIEMTHTTESLLVLADQYAMFQGPPSAREALRAALTEALARSAPQAVPAGWIDASKQTPSSGKTVLAFYKNSNGKDRRIRAKWIAAKTVESSSMSDMGEYDEASDTYYDPEGWYEQIDNWDEYTAIIVTYNITHWMPLPAAPKGAV